MNICDFLHRLKDEFRGFDICITMDYSRHIQIRFLFPDGDRRFIYTFGYYEQKAFLHRDLNYLIHKVKKAIENDSRSTTTTTTETNAAQTADI